MRKKAKIRQVRASNPRSGGGWEKQVGCALSLETEEINPVVRGGRNPGNLERGATLALAASKAARVVPKDKEIEISLHGIDRMKALTGVEKGFEQAIDGLSDAVGPSGRIKEQHQASREVGHDGKLVDGG